MSSVYGSHFGIGSPRGIGGQLGTSPWGFSPLAQVIQSLQIVNHQLQQLQQLEYIQQVQNQQQQQQLQQLQYLIQFVPQQIQ